MNPKTNFDQQIKEKNLSIRPCDICGNQVGVRDIRTRPILCYLHTNKAGSIKRYTNFDHGKLNQEEKERIMTDRTTRRGPFYGGK